MENLVDVLNNFGNLSGLKLNHATCTVLRPGTLTHCNVTFVIKKTFIWTPESAKPLGVNLQNDSNANLTNNFDPK